MGYLLRRVVSCKLLVPTQAKCLHAVKSICYCQCRLVVRTQASHAWDRGFDPLHWYFATFRSIGPHYAIMPSRTQHHVHLRNRSTDALQNNRRRSRHDNWNKMIGTWLIVLIHDGKYLAICFVSLWCMALPKYVYIHQDIRNTSFYSNPLKYY